MVISADELRRHQRDQGHRDPQRAEQRDADRDDEIAKELAGDALNEQDRQEHDDRRERRRDERHRHLPRAVDRSLCGRLALLDVLERHFEDHDAVVDEHSDREREPGHRDQVQRDVQEHHHGERDEDAGRHRDDRDEARAPTAQEREQNQAGQEERLNRRRPEVGDRSEDRLGLVEERHDVRARWKRRDDVGQRPADVACDLNGVGVALLADRHEDRGRAVRAHDVRLLLERVDDVRELTDEHRPAAAHGDHGVLDLARASVERGWL